MTESEARSSAARFTSPVELAAGKDAIVRFEENKKNDLVIVRRALRATHGCSRERLSFDQLIEKAGARKAKRGAVRLFDFRARRRLNFSADTKFLEV